LVKSNNLNHSIKSLLIHWKSYFFDLKISIFTS
jgi:hypothetical protein